ncbi:MAG TPA: ATP-binding protein [Polyangia bacterium]|nr:ATP-binding protein [Polyangia bacterium]
MVRLDDETPGTRRLYAEYRQEIWEHTDWMFLWLLGIQWLAGIATAIWVGSHGSAVYVSPLVWKAFFLGGGIAAFPMLVILRHPGSSLTRQEIAIGQALLTALITHLSGGRYEFHALPFVSLAFLAMYRDVSVLLLASLVTGIDRVTGCYWWPHSIYGVARVGHWAWFPDTAFMAIEALLLVLAIDKSQSDLLGAARKQATIDSSRAALEREVAERQRTERLLSLQYVITRVLAGSASLSEAAPLILRIMGENQGWQFGELWEVDEARQLLRCVDLWNADAYDRADLFEKRRRSALRQEEGLPGRVWQRHLPLWIADLSDEPLASSGTFAAESGLKGGFAIPLRNGPDVIGVMAFYSQQVRQANDDHLSMLSALGGQIGQFMERKRVEQGLRDSEERYRSVIAALDEGIILVDPKGKVIACNASCERILARQAADITAGDSAATFASAVDETESPVPAEELPFLATLLSGEARQNVVLGVTRGPDQTGFAGKVWISMNSQPLIRFGEKVPYAAMASFSDITARKAAEASLRAIMSELEVRVEKRTSQLMDANARLKSEVGERERAQREMHEAKEAADTANRAKSAFLANMSHELRTPLNAVIGFSELLEQEIFGGLNDKQRTYVGNVLVSGRHLLQLVNDILDISKVEAGRMDLAYERTPIGSVVDVVRGVIGALAAKRGINLEVDVSPNLPDVYVDPGRIKQVLYNLISNAIKFTPRGGVVRLTARADVRSLVVSVADTGVGIARADLPRLFREFEQLSQPNGTRPEGTGLGLALTRRLVELHGGRVEVESELGQGSTFSVHLPLRSPDDSTGIRTGELLSPVGG